MYDECHWLGLGTYGMWYSKDIHFAPRCTKIVPMSKMGIAPMGKMKILPFLYMITVCIHIEQKEEGNKKKTEKVVAKHLPVSLCNR